MKLVEKKKKTIVSCSGFEFLMRYYMKEQGQPLSQINVKERFEAMSVEGEDFFFTQTGRDSSKTGVERII